jgi:sphinganine-1-phosphate aldolase
MERIRDVVKDVKGIRPEFWEGMMYGALAYCVLKHGPKKVFKTLFSPSVMLKAAVGMILSSARALPGVSGALAAAEGAALQSIVDELAPVDPTARTALAAEPERADSVLGEIRKALDADMAASGFLKGKAFAGIYHHPQGELADLQGKVLVDYLNTNLLYPGIFKSARKMEAEAVAMVVSMLKGKLGLSSDPAPSTGGDDGDECGMLTTGGTESIMMAAKVYRDQAFAKYGGEAAFVPEVICGLTAHPAIDKACHYLGMKLVKLAVDKTTGELRPQDVERAINDKTVFIYASAPEFCHGVCDPIPELAALAKKRGIGLHVDNCVGGVLLSYMQRAQQEKAPTALAPIPAFDFTVPGVTTISCDIHKYGFAPKGASVVAFKNQEMRRFAFTTVTDWPGGLYATPTVTGSRSGASAAVAWATLRYMGGMGYQQMASQVSEMMEKMVSAINAIPELKVIGTKPHACIVSFTTSEKASFNAYSLVARMDEKGHHLNSLQSPPGGAVVVTERMAETVDDWIRCLKECVAEANKNPNDHKYEGKGSAGIYGASAVLPPSEVGRILQRYCDVLYLVRGPTAGAGAGGRK